MASFSDVLDNLISTSGSAFQSYQSANSNSFVPLQPGTYVNPQGQVVTANVPVSASSGTSMLILLALAAVFIFAFMQLRK